MELVKTYVGVIDHGCPHRLEKEPKLNRSKKRTNPDRVCHQLGKQAIGHEALETNIFVL